MEKKKINTDEYLKILKFAKDEMENKKVNFLMEDGAPAHTSKLSCEMKKNLGINVFIKKGNGQPGSFLWPGNSPDLNPIENAWSHLKTSIANLENPPTTKLQLKAVLRKKWKKQITDGIHKKLVNSFISRMNLLKKNNFENTKY